jgi:hypothetical protein
MLKERYQTELRARFRTVEATGTSSNAKTAAGTYESDSCRLQNASKNWVDLRGFLRMSVETTSGGKRRRINELAPEVARHRLVRKRANLRFDSRRLQFQRTRFVSIVYRCVRQGHCARCVLERR